MTIKEIYSLLFSFLFCLLLQYCSSKFLTRMEEIVENEIKMQIKTAKTQKGLNFNKSQELNKVMTIKELYSLLLMSCFANCHKIAHQEFLTTSKLLSEAMLTSQHKGQLASAPNLNKIVNHLKKHPI